MSIVPLAAQERLSAAFAHYEAVYGSGDRNALVAARLELCLALQECGEELPGSVLAQMERDRAELAQQPVLRV
ncbi:MAG: hypothetical protein QOE84_460 [Actinomycetota bacterium]|nr:hypothetical protein [Actinomycetota bacterium]MDT7548066.1 hypothetical protein [Actinomycetota bacterium]